MSRQEGLHLPIALITVKMISDRGAQVEAGERGAEGEGCRVEMMEYEVIALKAEERGRNGGLFCLREEVMRTGAEIVSRVGAHVGQSHGVLDLFSIRSESRRKKGNEIWIFFSVHVLLNETFSPQPPHLSGLM